MTEPGVPLTLPSGRLRSCVAAWEDAADGEFNPRCCRFPKACSPFPYPETPVTAADLEDPPAPPPPPRPRVFALVLREAPHPQGAVGYSAGVLATVLDADGKRVGEHWSSSASFGRTDGAAIAERLGGTLHPQVHDLTVQGRPWALMPIQGQYGCPVCGNVCWDQYAHARTCPPGQEYEDA